MPQFYEGKDILTGVIVVPPSSLGADLHGDREPRAASLSHVEPRGRQPRAATLRSCELQARCTNASGATCSGTLYACLPMHGRPGNNAHGDLGCRRLVAGSYIARRLFLYLWSSRRTDWDHCSTHARHYRPSLSSKWTVAPCESASITSPVYQSPSVLQ